MTTIALNNALSGLRASQQSLAVLSQNIANANNENYTRQTLSLSAVNLGSGVGAGVTIDSVDRQINEYLSRTVVTGSSNIARADVVSEYFTQLQNYLGAPGRSNSLDTYMNNFFNAMSQLSVTPETSSLKINAVAAGKNLAGQVSGLANNVQTLRYYADTEISQSVGRVNASLSAIYKINGAILSAKATNTSVNGLKDSMEVELKKIAAEMDITYRTEQDGTVSITTTSGVQLLSPGTLTQIDYTPATSTDDFSNGLASGAIKVFQVDESGKRYGAGMTLVSSGIGSSITSVITGGKIAGLLQIRDQYMPDVMAQLDNIASSITNAVNAIHNNGSGFPPLQTFTGTTMVKGTDAQNWNGQVMIAALDSSGKPILSPYPTDSSAGNGYAPLTIDLGKLNSGNGAGKPTYQTIIDEINHYYGAPQPRVLFGDLSNIELRSKSDSLAAGTGTFDFSLDLSSLAAGNSTFRVTGAAMSGGAVLTSTLNDVTVAGGSEVNTNGVLQFSADMSGAAAGPYTVTLNVEIDNDDGTTSTGVVTYTLNETAAGMRNTQVKPATATGQASIENPTGTQPILFAKLVDANGNEVAKDPSTGEYTGSGYLQITGSNSTYRVAINELNSSHQGDLNKIPADPATGFGFSHYMGLNNFFVDSGKVEGSALKMAVNQVVVNGPQQISIGKLTLSTQPVNSTAKRYTYEIGSGSNQTIVALSALNQNPNKFIAAGGLPETSLTFSDYAAQILGFAASKTTEAATDLSQQKLIQQGFIDKDKAMRGVNIDEEMANTILFQNAYSANARVITVTKQLFDDLLQAFI